MTPIWRPCICTASAFGFFGSNLIVVRPLYLGFVFVGRIEGAFSLAAMLVLISMIADERLHGGHERARDHQEVIVEHTHKVQKSVEAWHDLAGLDSGDMHLRQSRGPSQPGLAPAALCPLLFQLVVP